MARQAVPFFTDAVTASPSGATEIIIATLNGCSVSYPSDHFVIQAFADISIQAATTAVILQVRRTNLTGTIVKGSTTTYGAAATLARGPFPLFCTDAPGDVSNLTYVLTATLTAAGGASTVNLVGITAWLTS